jgi:hypothetical protein
MMKKTEPAENHGEKGAPFGVIVHLKIQGVGNQGLDGDAVDSMRERHARCRIGERSRVTGDAKGC